MKPLDHSTQILARDKNIKRIQLWTSFDLPCLEGSQHDSMKTTRSRIASIDTLDIFILLDNVRFYLL